MINANMKAFLTLHEKYGWKEQFLEDVKSIRGEARRRGGTKEETIEDAVQRYRRNLGASREMYDGQTAAKSPI